MTAGKIFISYRREDSAGYARALFYRLDKSFPKQVFMDVSAIDFGADFVDAIEKALRSCEAAIVIIGKDWLTAKDDLGNRRLDDRHDFVRQEVSTALRRGVRLIPVLVGGAAMPRKDLPPGLGPLKRHQPLQFSDQDWDHNVDQLISALGRAVGLPAKKESPDAVKEEVSQDDQVATLRQKFQPLPPPFHLPLADVLPKARMEAIRKSRKLVFHTAGDTGGAMRRDIQHIVAHHLQEQFAAARPQDRPAFFYHLGDVVFFHGGAEYYYDQFYKPYARYPAPIFAIPGNHDGSVDPKRPVPSLEAFIRNFCAATPHHNPEAGDSARPAMTQPNPFWTLDSPLATFIGLYTNIPEGGMLDEFQNTWLVTELKNAPTDRALILAMHHPIYSLSSPPMSSKYLAGVLDGAMKASGRYPDIVLASHVMNYQRFTRTVGARQIPFLVVGAGGYPRLRVMQKQSDGEPLRVPLSVPGQPGVILESYCADRHGFLRVTVTRKKLTGDYFSVPNRNEPRGAKAKRVDSFSIDLQRHRS